MHIQQLIILLLIFHGGRSFEEEFWDKHRAIRSTDDKGYSMGNVQLSSLIPKDYDILELPPTINDTAVLVNFNVLVMGIWNVDESHELLSVDLKLKIYWKDRRLSRLLTDRSPARQYCILKPQLLDYIWQPDVYIEKVKSIDHIALLSKPASLRIYPESILRYSARKTVTVSCQMDFRYYPVDTQRCHIDLQIYSFQIDRVKLGWENVARLLQSVKLSNFYIFLDSVNDYKNVTTGSAIGVKTEDLSYNLTRDVYSVIRFTIILKRRLSYHLLQTYLPSTIFILVSWLSFILPYESTSERMGYSMTCLFTLTSMFSAVRQSTPNVSYVKAIDVWMVTCMFFVFLTLVQHAILNRIKRSSTLEKYIIEKKFSQNNGVMETKNKNINFSTIEETSFTRNASLRRSKENKNLVVENDLTKREPPTRTIYQKIIKKMDRYLSLSLPCLFITFNIIYWSWLISIKYSE